jgi:hypothetical protein
MVGLIIYFITLVISFIFFREFIKRDNPPEGFGIMLLFGIVPILNVLVSLGLLLTTVDLDKLFFIKRK